MESEKEWCVYKHTNKINNKVYIGMTCKIESRFGKNGKGYLHKNKVGEYTQPAFANAVKKYGWDNFSHEIINDNLTKEDADILEEKMIKEYDSQNPKKGYNIKNGGSNGHLSERTKNKLKEAMKGRYEGKDNPFYGKHHSKEIKDLLSKNAKENARDISGEKNPMFGKELTLEEKYHKGDYRRGTKLSEDIKEKISKSNKEYYKTHIHHALGVHKTDEQKEKIRQKMLGREMDVQWKKKIGESHAPYVYVCVETNCEYYSSGEASRKTGIDKSSIQKVANGKANLAGGYHWIKKLKEK